MKKILAVMIVLVALAAVGQTFQRGVVTTNANQEATVINILQTNKNTFTGSTNTFTGAVNVTGATTLGTVNATTLNVTNFLLANSAISARVGGTIWVNTTSASNSVASETTLWLNTLPASSLVAQNDRLTLHAAGTMSNNGNTKAVAAYLGTTKIFDTTDHSFGGAADFWTLDIEIIRGASGTAEVINCRFLGQSANYINVTTATENLGTSLALKITATCTASGDAFYKSSSVQLWPAP